MSVNLNFVLLNTLVKLQMIQEEVFEDTNISISGIVGLRSDGKFFCTLILIYTVRKKVSKTP